MDAMGLKLNLGCGRSPQPGWVNVDIARIPGVDVVADLDDCRTQPLPFAESSVSQMQMLHVLEHMKDTLALM
jgi:predicted SAM-dependent methyltransferase